MTNSFSAPGGLEPLRRPQWTVYGKKNETVIDASFSTVRCIIDSAGALVFSDADGVIQQVFAAGAWLRVEAPELRQVPFLHWAVTMPSGGEMQVDATGCFTTSACLCFSSGSDQEGAVALSHAFAPGYWTRAKRLKEPLTRQLAFPGRAVNG